MSQFKPNPCPKCGSNSFYLRFSHRWTIREYCSKCDKWKKVFTERIDKSNEPSHCGKCKYFSETVFEGETENGWGSWYGDCTFPLATRRETRSRYYGCIFGEKKPVSETKTEVKVADGTPTTNDGIPPNTKVSGILPTIL